MESTTYSRAFNTYYSCSIHNCFVKHRTVKSEWPFLPGVTVYMPFLSGRHCPESATQLSGSGAGLLCGHPGVNRPRQIDS